MQKTIIGWTDFSWNYSFACSKVSDGCKHCYAETLALRYKQSTKPWTIPNEEENVIIKPHKLHEPYLIKEEHVRVFCNSTSDTFHRVIPDWFKAAGFCVMLDLPQHVFQILTKRAAETVDWHVRFLEAVRSEEFRKFRESVKRKDVRAALDKAERYITHWADHIWMGVSVEDARVLHRIKSLQASQAKVKFISAEPLIGAWGTDVDLSQVDWIIVGGESGAHLSNPVEKAKRWMKMEWAREIRDLCVRQGVAYFFKQDSDLVTEKRPYLVEADGSKWKWEQYPDQLTDPVNVDTGEVRPAWTFVEGMSAPPDDTPPTLPPTGTPVPPDNNPPPAPPAPHLVSTPKFAERPITQLTKFHAVKDHYDVETQSWDSDQYVYIGRYWQPYRVPESVWHNPFKLDVDTPESRRAGAAQYRRHIEARIAEHPERYNLELLRGKTLVCFCSKHGGKDEGSTSDSSLCHGHVLLDLLAEASTKQRPSEPLPVTSTPPCPRFLSNPNSDYRAWADRWADRAKATGIKAYDTHGELLGIEDSLGWLLNVNVHIPDGTEMERAVYLLFRAAGTAKLAERRDYIEKRRAKRITEMTARAHIERLTNELKRMNLQHWLTIGRRIAAEHDGVFEQPYVVRRATKYTELKQRGKDTIQFAVTLDCGHETVLARKGDNDRVLCFQCKAMHEAVEIEDKHRQVELL